jgi:hypothetical protein
MTMLSFRNALMTCQIAVRAYITKASQDKLVPYLRSLLRTMLEKQPAPRFEVRRRAVCQRSYAGERIGAWRQSGARLVRKSTPAQHRIIRRHVGWIADQQVKALRAERLVPAAAAELDAGQSEPMGVGAGNREGSF